MNRNNLKRNCEHGVVSINVTEDPKRIDQAEATLLSCNISEALKQSYLKDGKLVYGFKHILEYNVLRNELSHLQANSQGFARAPIQAEMGKTKLQQIDALMHETSRKNAQGIPIEPQGTFVIIHWVMTRQHADSMADMLASWNCDQNLMMNGSTIWVFTVSESLFSEPLRRLCFTQRVPTASDEEIRAVLTRIQKTMPQLHLQITDQYIAGNRGFTTHQVETVALEGIATSENRQFSLAIANEMKNAIFESMNLKYHMNDLTWNEIGGMPEVKNEFKFLQAQLKDPATTLKYGLKMPRGILLIGRPGVGKTILANACANELQIPMVELLFSNLYRSHVGESEDLVERILDLCERMSPMILFVDEAEALFKTRGTVAATDSGVNDRILTTLLKRLADKNRHYFVIMCTNRVEMMDEAAYRPGRIDEGILVTYPDLAGRIEIFKIQARINKMPIDPKLDFVEIAKQCPLITGAEIEKWCTLAARQAMLQKSEFITQKHFEETADQVAVDTKERLAEFQAQTKALECIKNINKPLMKATMAKLSDEIAQLEQCGGRMEAFASKLPEPGEPQEV